MIKNGKGGGNTKTGLVFEGKTDLATFLNNQAGYRVTDGIVFYNNEQVARIFKKHGFYRYADIIKYSQDIEDDLSHLKVKDFLEEMKKVAAESYRVLKKDKFCAVLMGDTRQKGFMIPMSFDVMRIFQDAGFKLKELIIKEQHNCKATGYWKTNSVKYNFLLIAHEYLFVFRK